MPERSAGRVNDFDHVGLNKLMMATASTIAAATRDNMAPSLMAGAHTSN